MNESLANCYFGNHRACNIVRPKRPADVPDVQPFHVATISKVFAADSIFGRDRYVRPQPPRT